MQQQKKKLELTWIGKDKRPRLEPRVLVEDALKSHHAATRRRDGKDIFDNMLIHGDNLLALKALEQQFTGKVKCIYIDPPYNTGNAFEHYDDGLEHSIWLGLMRERITMLYRLLDKNGSLWINIDDDEGHYLKVICDEIFGRENFVATVIWHKKGTRSNDARWFSDNHDFLMVYAKNKFDWRMNLLPRPEDSVEGYSNPDNDPRGVWASGPCHAKTPNEKDIYEILTPSGKRLMPPPGTSWRFSKDRFAELVADNRIWFGKNGANVPRYKRFLTDVKDGFVPTTIWFRDEIGDNQEAKKEVKGVNPQNVFPTPKPERLIQRVLTLATNPGDLVLDSFLGSGTTAAVAHKMGRRWIGVELGDHCYTHCKVRLDKVIDGTDAGGITKAVDWKGGGGYRFYELAPTLIKKDKWGQMIINPEYDAEKLAEAVCKLEGFTYAPSESEYFIHGKSTERDYIYVTTNYLKAEHLRALSELVGPERTLLICCKGFENCGGRGATALPGGALGDRALPGRMRFPNLTVKKIPKAVLDKCEYGHDDYSLNVKNLPMAAPELEQGELFD